MHFYIRYTNFVKSLDKDFLNALLKYYEIS